jgi:hypothetical protein
MADTPPADASTGTPPKTAGTRLDDPPDLADTDPEVTAIHRVIAALGSLDEAARRRVLDYVGRRYGMSTGAGGAAESPHSPFAFAPSPPPRGSGTQVRPPGLDIRSLKEEKQPGSLTEMVALVAYYLREVATPPERKDTITTPDVEKYFKQAGYRLPSRSRMVLVNARNAGYLDPTGETGVYKLNPVGYNLVAHSLPAGATRSAPKRRSKAKPRKAST